MLAIDLEFQVSGIAGADVPRASQHADRRNLADGFEADWLLRHGHVHRQIEVFHKARDPVRLQAGHKEQRPAECVTCKCPCPPPESCGSA
jgi:hypothetical protein